MFLLLEFFEKELGKLTGIQFDSYNSDFLISLIRERMLRLGSGDQEDYLEKLRKDPAEAHIILQSMGVNVSEFFRNPLIYEILENRIFPDILWQKTRNGSKDLRIWSAGCASGEEPYSIAILLDRLLHKQLGEWQINIFATDINTDNLSMASAGLYDAERLKEVKLSILNNYFKPAGNRYRLKKQIRSMVSFSLEDLATRKRHAPAESIFGSFDLILCRNVMIYFNRQAQERTLAKIARALSAGGYLVLGESERLLPDETDLFTRLDDQNHIFIKN